MFYRIFVSMILMSIYISLSGCDNVKSPMLEPKTTPPVSPQKGMATVIGRVVSEGDNKPITDTIVRMAEVVRQGGEGAYVLDIAQSPGTRSDQNGYFIFENVNPQEYVIIIGDVYDVYKVVSGDDQKPIAWATAADQILDVGTLSVDLGGE